MSWNVGSHETITLVSSWFHARSNMEQLWSRLPCVTSTPLGTDVDPDVYWTTPSVSASMDGSRHSSARPSDTSSVAIHSSDASSGASPKAFAVNETVEECAMAKAGGIDLAMPGIRGSNRAKRRGGGRGGAGA